MSMIMSLKRKKKKIKKKNKNRELHAFSVAVAKGCYCSTFSCLDDNSGPILKGTKNLYLHLTSVGVIQKQMTVPLTLQEAQTITKLKSEPLDKVSKY